MSTLAVGACAGPAGLDIYNALSRTEPSRGWNTYTWQGDAWPLRGFLRGDSGSTLRVYMEGDGRSWDTRNEPALDPTPVQPVAFELARQDVHVPLLYLGRPCQYLGAAEASRCPQALWTTGRFSVAALDAFDQAINEVKSRVGAGEVVLFGYSGGGVVATLLAARRNDVVRLVTVASPLDHQAWTALHGVTPLNESLRPLDYIGRLRNIPQHHYAGGRDRVVPPSVIETYMAKLSSPVARFTVVPNFDHRCCWSDRWPQFITP